MTSKDTDVVGSRHAAAVATLRLTDARAALAAATTYADKIQRIRDVNRAEEALIQANRRKAALGG